MVDSPKRYREKVSQLISWGHWFSFFNIIASMLIGTRYIFHSGWPSTLFGQLYQILTWIGHFGFLTFAVYLLLIFPASFIITSQRVMRLFASIVATLGLSLLLLDLYVYQNMHLHINQVIWDLVINNENSNTDWQYLFVILPSIFFLELILSEWVWRKQRALSRKRLGQPIALVFALCFFSSHIIHTWADANLYSPITAQRSNFPLSYPMTAKSFMAKYGLFDKNEYLKRRNEQNKKQNELMKYPLTPLTFNPKANQYKPNVLIVMVEGLRADMLNAVVMPNLYQFSQQNFNFKNHYSSGNDDMAGSFGLFYGIPANYVKSVRSEAINPLLLENLAKKDYQFSLFSSNNFESPFYYRTIFGQFQKNIHSIDQNNQHWKKDQLTIDTWAKWLENNSKTPWFSYIDLDSLNYYENSGDYKKPFQPNLDGSEKLTQLSKVEIKNSYQNAAHHIDSLLANLFTTLSNKKLLDNTVVLITSNHGVEFNETQTNSWGSNINYAEYQVKVPFVLHWPESEAKQFDIISSHLDLVPTLMEEILGVESPASTYSMGSNLFDIEHNPKNYVLAGDSKDIVIIQKDQTIVVDKFGNYTVYDKNYQEKMTEKPQLSLLMQTIHELNKFYAYDIHENHMITPIHDD